MNSMHRIHSLPLITAFSAIGLLVVATASNPAERMEWSERNPVTAELTGAKELPPVSTQGYGRSTITVAKDRSVRGTVIVQDMKPTSAHIHQGGLNSDGPVIIPLAKTSETTFSVPPNTKLTEEQYARFKEGNLYVNVHSERYPSGEIRAQMAP